MKKIIFILLVLSAGVYGENDESYEWWITLDAKEKEIACYWMFEGFIPGMSVASVFTGVSIDDEAIQNLCDMLDAVAETKGAMAKIIMYNIEIEYLKIENIGLPVAQIFCQAIINIINKEGVKNE